MRAPSPSEHPLQRPGVAAAAWAALAAFSASYVLLSTVLSGVSPTLWKVVLWSGADAAQWIVLAPLVFLLAERFRVRRGSLRGSLPAHLCCGSALALLTATGGWAVRHLLGMPAIPYASHVGLWFHPSLQWYVALVAIHHALDHHRALKQRTRGLERQLTRARLEALQRQIHPHFLFNTLGAIAETMHHDVRRADRMISQMCEILRAAYRGRSAITIPLREEIELLRAYVHLVGERHQERLQVALCADPGAGEARLPPFVLQPLVENAIRHALAGGALPARVTVHAARRGERLRVTVRDNGPGLRPRPAAGRTGVGLRNIAERLHAVFGDAHRLELRDRVDGPGAEAVLEVPLVPARGAGAEVPALRAAAAGATPREPRTARRP